jgi:hypothetical protein
MSLVGTKRRLAQCGLTSAVGVHRKWSSDCQTGALDPFRASSAGQTAYVYVPRPLPLAPIERLKCLSDTWERVPISVIGADERSRIASCSRNQAMISFRRPPVGRAHRKTFVSLLSSPIHQYSLTTIKLQSRLPARVKVKMSTANPCR